MQNVCGKTLLTDIVKIYNFKNNGEREIVISYKTEIKPIKKYIYSKPILE